jgi:hypothetical protein
LERSGAEIAADLSAYVDPGRALTIGIPEQIIGQGLSTLFDKQLRQRIQPVDLVDPEGAEVLAPVAPGPLPDR